MALTVVCRKGVTVVSTVRVKSCACASARVPRPVGVDNQRLEPGDAARGVSRTGRAEAPEQYRAEARRTGWAGPAPLLREDRASVLT